MLLSWKRTKVLAVGAAFSLPAFCASAAAYSVVHSFGANSTDGTMPKARLTQDKRGNLWGTTYEGGAYRNPSCGSAGCGTVFKIAANGAYSVVHNFGANGSDGNGPLPGLIQTRRGNLWGTTASGGAHGRGTVFEIATNGTYSVAYSFGASAADGKLPQSGLTQDETGDLWGTTVAGGAHNAGTLFKVAANGAYSLVYDFGAHSTDGTGPLAGLILLKTGSFWGTTYAGGGWTCDGRGCGTVFSFDPRTGREKIVHSFGGNSSDGWSPYSGLMRDSRDIFWGTTYQGGAHSYGTLFKVTANRAYSVVHSFGANGTDGTYPYAGLTEDTKGNLWGTTVDGGAHDDGTVFAIAANGTYTIVRSFGANSADGVWPYAGLMRDRHGNLWGTTYQGGAHGAGTVFKIKP